MSTSSFLLGFISCLAIFLIRDIALFRATKDSSIRIDDDRRRSFLKRAS